MTRARSSISVVLLASIAILATVYIAQYGFGLLPCELCLKQRIPFGVTLVLAALALVFRLDGQKQRIALGLCGLAFAVGAGLALYHVGVEQHWWAGPTACTAGAGTVTSVEDLAAMLSKPVNVPMCDQPAWTLFGISMAGYNVLASVVLAIFSVVSARRAAGGV
jgi:disulfide bond formation protein DsbB